MFFIKFKDNKKKIENHINDLRKHIFIALISFLLIFIVFYYFSNYIYEFLQKPLLNILNFYGYTNNIFIVTSLPEGFFSYIKITFFSTCIFFIPIFIWQILLYILPIIYRRNIRKKLIILLGILAPILFYLGILFSYYCMFYIIWDFLVKFNLAKKLALYLKISEYIHLSLSVVICTGISFELPIFLYILFCLGIINYDRLKKTRKLFIVAAFIISAVITPPDPLSQIIMATILILLFESSLFFIKISDKDNNINI